MSRHALRPWTALETRLLSERPDLTVHQLADTLSRTPAEAGLMLARLRGGHYHRPWTVAEDARLRELAAMPIAWQAEAVGRTRAAVADRRHILGLGRPRTARPWHTPEHRALARMTLAEAIAAHPERTPGVCGRRGLWLGVLR